MSRTEWPALCTLADAARLFTEAGHKVDRSNVSRFVKTRNFPKTDGKVDPTALFAVFRNDFTRQSMAGELGGAAPLPAQAPAQAPTTWPPQQSAPGDDPKRDLNRVQARMAQLALEEKLGKTLPVEEVAAAMAESIAELRAVGLRVARDEATRLLADLGAPGHKLGAAVAGLRRYLNALQEAFAASSVKLLAASSGADGEARTRLDALVALDLQLRGESNETAASIDPQ